MTGTSFTTSLNSLSQNAAPEGSGDLAITALGSEFTTQSTVLFNGQPLATSFVNTGQIHATIPAALLAAEGTANITVSDPQNGLSNTQTFSITENVPAVSASVSSKGRSSYNVTLSGQVVDQAFEDHQVRVDWGDGTVQMLDLGSGRGGSFSVNHHYKKGGPRVRTINLTARDDVGTVSTTLLSSRPGPQVKSASTWAGACGRPRCPTWTAPAHPPRPSRLAGEGTVREARPPASSKDLTGGPGRCDLSIARFRSVGSTEVSWTETRSDWFLCPHLSTAIYFSSGEVFASEAAV